MWIKAVHSPYTKHSSGFQRGIYLIPLWFSKGKRVSAFWFNPKNTGGGGGPWWPPPRHIARLLGNAQSSRRDTLWQFLLSSPHILTPNLWRPRVRFQSYVTLCTCTCTSNRKWLQNVIFNANRFFFFFFFSLSSYKYAYFHSQLLKLISFWFIVLQKVSATNFGEKTNKNKRSKKQRNT